MAIKYAKRMDLFKKSELGEILKLIEQPDIISFAGGLPASELFPVEEMKKLGYHEGYLYPHDFPGHWVEQQYLPDALKNQKYYEFGDNKNEQAAKEYWSRIKKK